MHVKKTPVAPQKRGGSISSGKPKYSQSVGGNHGTRRDLIDPELFGNEAGDDEDFEILNSYFLDKPEFARFYSPATRLAFVRSRKGVGKSALLKQTLYRRKTSGEGELLIHLKASDLIALQEVKSDSPDELVYGWQQRICTQVNLELGTSLKVAFSDDSMLLIESAELAGFRNRNLVSALFDRLKIKGAGAEFDRARLPVADAQALLTRVLEKKDVTVWLFIDDVDATFINTEHERLKASTFFSACRNLVSSVQGLCIRAAVRTDVWSVLAQHDEALDKSEQYMLDLTWSTMESGRILENKIHSYFTRYYPDDVRFTSLVPDQDGAKIRHIVFKEPFQWGNRPLESFRPIHILSAGRPRWAAQLCKLAGRDAFDKNTSLISIGHVRSVLREYGQLRVNDLYKEHRHQCPTLQELVESFSGGTQRFTTDELLDHISEKIVKRIGVPAIDGVNAEKGTLSVAHFLFRCGFIAARDETDPTGLVFVRYEERPNLLSTRANLDDGLDWEIHPSYRQVLRISARNSGDEVDL
jgi:hypothetical protein